MDDCIVMRTADLSKGFVVVAAGRGTRMTFVPFVVPCGILCVSRTMWFVRASGGREDCEPTSASDVHTRPDIGSALPSLSWTCSAKWVGC